MTKIKMFIFLFIIICNLLFSYNLEEFYYKTKFKGLRVGHTKISLLNDTSLDSNKKIITIESYSTKLLDIIYKLRHFSTIIINSNDYSLIGTTQKIQQAKYIDSFNTTVDNTAKIIYYENTQDLNNSNRQNSILNISFDNKIYDPFAIVYYLRKLNLEVNKVYEFQSFSKTTIRKFSLEIIGIEKINTPYINHDCFIIIPKSLDDKNVLKHKGEMKIWITKNKDRLPIKIQQKMSHGTMELVLKDYNVK